MSADKIWRGLKTHITNKKHFFFPFYLFIFAGNEFNRFRLSFNKIYLYIKSNKLIYKENEIIKIEIFPKDLVTDISYNNITKKASNYAEFNTNKQSNKITAKYNNLSYDKVIFIIT